MLSCYKPGRQLPAAYGGFQLEAMSAHGGWLFTARDLVRLALAADGLASPPDIVSAATLRTMTKPSAVATGYAKGWMVDGRNWWHTGQLDGTASLVMHTASGYTWAILLNTSNGSAQFWQELEALGWTWPAGAAGWPMHDLFAPTQNASDLLIMGAEASHPYLAWTNGPGTGRLLLLKPDRPITDFPLDGTTYPVDTKLADGTIIAANGPKNTAELPHLNPQRTYYARVVEYRQDATTGNRSVYTLDGNPTLVLPPAGRPQPLPLLALGPNETQDATMPKGSTTPENTAFERKVISNEYFLRFRRAWRKGLAHFVKM